ncbi:hypothetical protein C8F04DRAFT_1068174 [Mycena alexandri]|uniref:Uncharacterized protein n=1 Tax=Mycena alexandri TaxID=1745969 RepID=A0AAD6XCT8_9AGAR|nr:hypothetical protein C8F04DRAFT_1068174 [Mycena alexandri]
MCLLQLPLVSPFLSVWDWRCVYAHPLLAYIMVPHSVACAERSALIRDRGEGAAYAPLSFSSVRPFIFLFAYPSFFHYSSLPLVCVCAADFTTALGAAHTSPPSHFVWSPYAVGPTALIIFCSRVRA